MNFFSWHKRQTDWWLQKLGMSDYAALWFAYFKGAFTAVFFILHKGYMKNQTIVLSYSRSFRKESSP